MQITSVTLTELHFPASPRTPSARSSIAILSEILCFVSRDYLPAAYYSTKNCQVRLEGVRISQIGDCRSNSGVNVQICALVVIANVTCDTEEKNGSVLVQTVQANSL